MLSIASLIRNHQSLLSKKIIPWFILIGLLITLYIGVFQMQQIQRWWSEATGKPAHLVIHNQRVTGPLKPIWQGVSQGLEGNEQMLIPVIEAGKELNLQIIRIDHVFNQYDLVSRNQGQLVFNFNKLDQLIQSILQMNATPMLSLSYMPTILSSDRSITGSPRNWLEWEQIVEAVINRYSGRNGMGIFGIYYEVWNEPDLYGKWRLGKKNKDYLILYQHTALAASRVKNAEKFYLGGPATTGMYPNWIKELVILSQVENLQLDFLSWHRYSPQIDSFFSDVNWVKQWLDKNQVFGLQLMITEWGINAGLDTRNDTSTSAAHAVAVIRQVLDDIDWVLPFELKDGLDPNKKPYWGRWGMITHEQFGAIKKPRFHAFELLNQLGNQRLLVLGEGSWVQAIASIKQNGNMAILITNYDYNQQHSELVPIDILGLQPGQYTWKETKLDGQKTQTSIKINTGILSRKILMPSNEVVLVEIGRL